MKIWQRINKEWEDSFSAAAFAEAGEFDCAKEIAKDLNGWIVLVGEGDNLSHKVISYVKKLCLANRSALKIIWKGKISEDLFVKELKDIFWQADLTNKELNRILPVYLRQTKNIKMVISSSNTPRLKALANKINREFMCPFICITLKK
ncbi:hypothetical protein Thein_0321 [Thermodesulfatator indicus DSM 15286]|uniref:Uncharacterized protein n=1 Tax=Thermodesulfatator indicus (strain DSM 15286 / JCM 11887 / CIR29812) TaxID=667014 RepID=F8AA69_THEID|nr:hypothetical protein [Thermodesulfatator indicus]AEH44205.1 hypothetical protein Thein_0321 [Thermodesulfatator indicus DSM 15286]